MRWTHIPDLYSLAISCWFFGHARVMLLAHQILVFLQLRTCHTSKVPLIVFGLVSEGFSSTLLRSAGAWWGPAWRYTAHLH